MYKIAYIFWVGIYETNWWPNLLTTTVNLAHKKMPRLHKMKVFDRYVCEICSREFTNRGDVVQHNFNNPCSRVDTKTKSFSCHFCPYQCHGLLNLEVHLLLQHSHQTCVRTETSKYYVFQACFLHHRNFFSISWAAVVLFCRIIFSTS